MRAWTGLFSVGHTGLYEQYALRLSRSMQCSTKIMVSSDILTLPAVHVGLDRMDLRIAATNH